ncbi:unnamed protein product [Gordionus sp. m RMFG-2023]|uniref:gamma-glutamylcyclotransferase-like n=1 Tax=Gordionus sp. m RMFG-2023 TaxID=3053472 RepID=UPI0030E52D87
MSGLSNKLYYFAYGSNINSERLKLSITTANFVDIGYVKNYKLDFALHSKRWKGACATIVPSPNDIVWGVIWLIENEDKSKLDIQENINEGVYDILDIECDSKSGDKKYCCFAYVLKLKDECKTPSKLYKNVIINGAKEHKFPEYYIAFLNDLEDNGYEENFEYFKEKICLFKI